MVLALEGIIEDQRDPETARLEQEVRRLRRELADATVEAQRGREDADRALRALRRQLAPLYSALQAVFGELDAAGVTDESPSPRASDAPDAPAITPRVKAVWENWKQQLPGYPARIIDALLLHADLNTAQLAIACGCKRQRISEGIVKLNKAGLVNKNAGRFSLKSL